MKTTSIWLLFPLVGALLFWGADALVMAYGRSWPPPVWISAKTFPLPLACGTAFWHLVKAFSSQNRLMPIAMAMVAGIWLSGPLYFISFYLLSGARPMSAGEMLFSTILFPFATLMVSLYNGSFGGLMITCVLLGILGTGWLGVPGRRNTTKKGGGTGAAPSEPG